MSYPYVSCPTLEQLYVQKSVCVTPYGAAKVPLQSYETASLVQVRDAPRSTTTGGASSKMSFPCTLRNNAEVHATQLAPSRLDTNIFSTNPMSLVSEIPTGRQQCRSANAIWQSPPLMFNSQPSSLAMAEDLPRDTLHPLVSHLQAGENSKAAALNPAVAFLANVTRKDPPCEAHRLTANTAMAVRTTNPSGGGDGEEDEELDVTVSSSPNSKQKLSRRGDLRTFVGRAYNTEGGFHEPEHYASKIIEHATSQPETLTSIAAKALAAAIHDNPSHSIAANAFRSRHAAVLPNSGPTGTNVNRYEHSKAGDASNPVVPPPQSFRNLCPELQEALLKRDKSCRHRVAQILTRKYASFQPAPLDATGMASATQYVAPMTDQRRREEPKGTADDPEEFDYVSDSESDRIEGLQHFASLSLWLLAMRQVSPVVDPAGNLPHASHPASEVVLTKRLRVITPTIVSLYNPMSQEMQPQTLLDGVGISMNGTLTLVKAASTSSFLENRGPASTGSTAVDLDRVPPNSYGFDTERLSSLLLDKGGEIEHIFLEGAAWLGSSAFSCIGRHCINLRLLNVANCIELGDEQVVGIATKCHSLGYLNISGCTKVSGVGLAAVFEHCRDLYALCIGRLPLLDDTAELAFAQVHRAAKLSILDVSYSENITDASILAVAQHCRMIEMIDISGCVLLTDVAVMALGASCPRVWALKLKLCPLVTNQGFANLTSSMRQLRILDIACNATIAPSGFLSILKTIPMLQRLTIAGCSQLGDTAIASITQYSRRLRYLNIASCQGVSMASLMELVHELTALRLVVVSESSISNAEVVMLSALRESCKIIRNQYRPRAPTKLLACKAPAPKVKGAAAPGGKKAGKK